jgi:hypothetical protein
VSNSAANQMQFSTGYIHIHENVNSSVADVYPGSRIQKTATKERGEKKFVVIPFFVATNFTKLKIILFLIC